MKKLVFTSIALILIGIQAVSLSKHQTFFAELYSAEVPNKTLPIYFATNRNRDAEDIFGKKLASEISYGRIDVQVPTIHERGSFEVPRFYNGSITENPKKHFVAIGMEDMSDREFQQTIIQSTPNKTAIVYVHGFSFSFKRSVFKAAQLAVDMGLQGSVIAFSWPTNNSFKDYYMDKEDADNSTQQFAHFLRSIRELGFEKVHLISHSMGNYLLAQTIALTGNQIFNSSTQPLFDQMILAAPDISISEYKQNIEPRIQTIARRTTIYGSSGDLALKASLQLNDGQKRLGLVDEVNGPEVYEGLDYIDATDIESDLVFSMHHTYYGRARIMDDMKRLFDQNDDPFDRGLFAVPLSARDFFWKIFRHRNFAHATPAKTINL